MTSTHKRIQTAQDMSELATAPGNLPSIATSSCSKDEGANCMSIQNDNILTARQQDYPQSLEIHNKDINDEQAQAHLRTRQRIVVIKQPNSHI
jgi:hypothetical protein